MKIEIDAKELKDKLTKVGYAINRRATLPIMSGVKIEAAPTGITFYATDLEKAVKIGVDGEVIAEGKAVVEHKMLKEAVKSLKDTVTIEAEENKVTVNEAITLPIMPIDEYPPEPTPENILDDIMLSSTDVQRVIHAASEDKARPILQGIYVGKKLIATDGYRLATTPISRPSQSNYIIPATALQICLKISKDDMTIQFTEKHAHILLPDAQIVTWLIEGNYPNTDMIINGIEQAPHYIKLNRIEVIEAIKQVELPAKEGSGAIHVISNGDHNVRITSNNRDEMTAEVLVSADIEGTPEEFGINYKFLLECLNVLQEDIFTIQMNKPDTPIFIQEGAYTEVIMPLHLG